MSTPLYDVMLTGQVAEGHDPQVVIAALARLFGRDARHIADLMNNGGQIIKRQVGARTGHRYLESLAKAGAVGRLIPANPATAQASPDGTKTISDNTADRKVQVIAPRPKPADVAFSPIQANRISSAPQGIDINRADTPPIAFEDIALLAAYEDQEAETIYGLIFRHGQKRPYLFDANQIVFTDFSGTKATSVIASLRLFIQFVAQRNPTLYVDPGTAGLIDGSRPAILEIDLAKYTTSLGAAIQSVAGDPAA